MQRGQMRSDTAVSPVVGVMLMLVVVIIIAAVTSAFGGGIVNTEKKAPQASIMGEYSQYHGLTMTHMGGDSLETMNTKVYIRRSEEFGAGMGDFAAMMIDETAITNGRTDYGDIYTGTGGQSLQYWRNPANATFGVTTWRPGEKMYVIGGDDLIRSGLISKTDYPPCYNEDIQGGQGTTGGLSMRCYVTSLNNQINVGKTVYLEIMTKDGKTISSTPVIIEP